ncbi:RagB/SusD family nutrient uptake outer membrane protein [Labilibacter sediminis]|nr:RagB/SusD family nutrient uptake outer membrane protein [Labilibacter sediminis]
MMNMKYIINISVAAFMALSFVGCNDYFEPEIDENRSEEQIWSHPEYAEGMLLGAYKAMPSLYNTYGNDFLDCATGNATSNNYGASMIRMSLGGWSSNSNPIDSWSDSFQQIRNINLFIEKGLDVVYVDHNAELDSMRKVRLKGEAYFLRAWYQWQLLQNHAGPDENGNILGFPILTKVYTQDDEVNIPRASYEACLQQILDDCDTSSMYLPFKYESGAHIEINENNVGRATKTAAMALKSRASLYAASPLFNPVLDSEKWKIAASLSKDIIDVIGNLPSINTTFYNDPNSSELIMRKYEVNKSLETANFPLVLNGNGRTNPSQNLVDAFPMANGYPIADEINSGYLEDDPYTGRDPRFYSTILYQGASFKDTTMDFSTDGPNSELASPERASRTGYMLRKWMSPDVRLDIGNPKTDEHYYALFRKVEMYLNYAEAANEAWSPEGDPLGIGMTAKDAINAVRSRAGITSTAYVDEVAAQGKEAFRELIKNERRIELCFENHYFYDLRRWNSSIDQLNETIQGMEIERVITETDTTYQLTVVDVKTYNYQDYMLYGPIPYSEVLKSSEIVQNKGW